MSRDSGTRSGLLWEVERLLNEVDELPQILLMENVPDVLSDKFIKDFAYWCEYLERKGYKNYTEILNAKDYGVPQNRERCFMLSFLGDYYYEFPASIPLTLRLKDVLENEVDEKYYLSKKAVEGLTRAMNREHKPSFLDSGGYCPTIDTRVGALTHRSPYVKQSAPADEAAPIGTVGIASSRGGADGLYLNCTEAFQRKPLKDVSRTIKADTHPAGVIEYE